MSFFTPLLILITSDKFQIPLFRAFVPMHLTNIPTREQMKELVGFMITFWRKKRKFNETQLGAKCGKTCSKISNYELGVRLGDPFQHQKVADALKIELKDLYDFRKSEKAMHYIIKHKLKVLRNYNSTNN